MLCFPGTFDSFQGAVNHNNDQARAYAADPDLNGTNGPKPAVSFSFSLWDSDGSCTFATIIAGQNDAGIVQLISDWATIAAPPILEMRIDWEDDYPTTPAGEGAQNGKFPAGNAGPVNDAWIRDYIAAWRHVAKLAKATAARLAPTMVFRCGWGPTIVDYCPIDPRAFYPDNDTSDGAGSVVDFQGPDWYSQYYGGIGVNRQLFNEGDLQPLFTNTPQTGTAPADATWARSRGSNARSAHGTTA